MEMDSLMGRAVEMGIAMDPDMCLDMDSEMNTPMKLEIKVHMAME